MSERWLISLHVLCVSDICRSRDETDSEFRGNMGLHASKELGKN